MPAVRKGICFISAEKSVVDREEPLARAFVFRKLPYDAFVIVIWMLKAHYADTVRKEIFASAGEISPRLKIKADTQAVFKCARRRNDCFAALDIEILCDIIARFSFVEMIAVLPFI